VTIVVNAFFGTGDVRCPWVMVHATDRLVSLQHPDRFEPKYPVFNKTVVYRASDAIVTIGFTGLAFLDGQPTDEWLASTLAGTKFDPFAGLHCGQHFDVLNLGQATSRLEQGLNELASRHVQVGPLSLMITGARRKRHRWQRTAISIERDADGLFRRRHHAWETRDQWHSRLFVGPRGWLGDEYLQARTGELALCQSVADIERVADRIVTDAGIAAPTAIGRDITGATLLATPSPTLDVVYLHRSAEPMFEGFTPWIIGSRTALAPVAVSAPMGIGLNGVRVRWRPVGLSSVPTGREAAVTDGLAFSFRPHPDRENL